MTNPQWTAKAHLLIDQLRAHLSEADAPPKEAVQTPIWSTDTRKDVIALQTRLSDLGYLDPPADGGWGPVSKWALGAVLEARAQDVQDAISNAQPLPINPVDDLAGKIIRAMVRLGYWIARHPDCVNVVYVEGINPDGTRNDNKPNQFNDLRCVIYFNRYGVPMLGGAWEATTEPGLFWTQHRMNPDGAFHIKLGQYKAWCLGMHHTHEAWVQCGEIEGYRDANNLMVRDLNHPVKGSNFGVNQHWGYDLPRNNLANSSAGCLVGRSTEGHKEFMRITKNDARFKASPSYRIMTTILSADDVLGTE